MVGVSKVRKRSGKIVEFDKNKITAAIEKAFLATNKPNGFTAKRISDEVVTILNRKFLHKIPSVEDVQDIVEKVLIKNNYPEVAKAYILYREKRAEIRRFKKFYGVGDELKLGVNALKVLAKRYLLKNDKGQIIETPNHLFKRVAKAMASVEKNKKLRRKYEKEFYKIMANLDFLPNTPTLMNAGTKLGQLSACFVLPVGDSLKEIYDAVKYMALIQQSGGGTGFSFSRLRPKGDIVRSTKGVASGPVSFMRIFDITTDVIKQGGKRRGANMGILRVDHPDILEFISAKTKEGFLSNFNISVAVTDKFMDAVFKNKDYDLINPRTKKPVGRLNAKEVFNLICYNAWRTGDPGMVFLDEINRHNPTPKVGEIESTNPCGEQPLLPYESCNLGSINLSKFVENGKLNWNRLRKVIRLAVRFLDNVIDTNKFPLKETEKITKANRKIGLGVMGFAEMLIKLGIPYDSNKAIRFAERLMKFIESESHAESVRLGKEKGSFPNFKQSIYYKKYPAMRNSTVTTIAPTGTISIIAGCSSGIEPLFAVSFIRNVMEGTHLIETNSIFEEIAKKRGFYSSDLMMEIAKQGSIQNIKEIPKDVRRLFVTALDIKPEWHVRMQAAFQEYTDNAVSKTINLPVNATVNDVKKAYLLAYKLKCKGITVYRYGSKPQQVLYIGPLEKKLTGVGENEVSAESEYAGGCPDPYCVH